MQEIVECPFCGTECVIVQGYCSECDHEITEEDAK
jgi:hypothetical protein